MSNYGSSPITIIFKMDFDLEEIYRWIDSYPLARPKKNINRDFSDAMPVVEILKFHYPKLVELHNYSPANSFVHKLENWDILNKKVLTKLDLVISEDKKKQLARAVPGAVEKLLHDIKKKIESREKKPSVEEIYQLEGLPKEPGAIVPIKMKNGSSISEQKIVPTAVFDKMQNDILEKEEAITILKNKVQHLENLLAIKDERIKDLSQQLESTSKLMASSPISNVSSTRFFKKIIKS